MATRRNSNALYIRILAIIAAVTLLGCAGIAVYYWNNTAWGIALSQQDETLKAYKDAGLPWTADELKLESPKGATNAGPLIKQSQKDTGLARDRSKLDTVSSELSAFYNSRKASNIRVAVAAVSTRLTEARKIGDCTYCDFERDYDRGAWMLLPELSHVKMLVKLLVAASIVDASRRDFSTAVRNIERALSISGMASTEPNLIGPLVSIACYSICFKATESLAEMMGADSSALASLSMAVERQKPVFSVHRSLQGEAYMGIATARNLRNVKPIGSEQELYKWEPLQRDLPESPSAVIRSGFPENRFARAYVIRHMQTLTKFANEAKNTKDLYQLGAKIDTYAATLGKKDRSYAYTELVLPVFTSCFASIQQCYSNYEVQTALVRVLAFRASKRRFPSSLREAGYKGSDPITGVPLKVWHSGKMVEVYSFGVDKTDDGGLRRQERASINSMEYKGYDIVASYPAYRPSK